jgi:isocitrate/isopropylmalate dehydrogenase
MADALRIAVVPGDGIGPEVIAQAEAALGAVAAASGRAIALSGFDWGADRYLATGFSLPDGALQWRSHVLSERAAVSPSRRVRLPLGDSRDDDR